MAGLYLDDISLLLDTKQRTVAHLDKYLPVERIEPGGYLARALQTSDFPVPNYRRDYPMLIGVNQFYFPTGATRWGYGFALCGKEVKDHLDAGSYTSIHQIKFATPRNTIITPMLVLDPIPVTGEGSDGQSPRLWILPLVDMRYKWQFTPVDLQVNSTTTWESVLDAIIAALPGTISYGSIPSQYSQPDPRTLTRKWGNGGVLLEAVSGSLGLRCVRDWGGTYTLEDPAAALLTHNANIAATPEHLYTGGDIDDTFMPDTVRVSFRKSMSGLPAHDWWNLWSETEQVTCTDNTDAEKKYAVQSTMWAVFLDKQAVSPTNLTELQDLTTQVKDDYQAWTCRAQYDRGYTGLQDWNPSGFDDCVVINFGSECDPELKIKDKGPAFSPELVKDYRRLVTLRAMSHPSNFGVSTQLSASALQDVDEDGPVHVRMTADMIPGDSLISGTYVGWNNGTSSWDAGPTVSVSDYYQNDASQDPDMKGSVCALTNEIIACDVRNNFGWLAEGQPCEVINTAPWGLQRHMRADVDIKGKDTGTAVIIRHDGTDGPQVAVRNLSADEVEQGSEFIGEYCKIDGVWDFMFFIDSQGQGGGGDRLVYMQVGTQQTPWQHMLPGQSVGGQEMVWRDTTPCGYVVDPAHVDRTLYDPQKRNCLLAQEYAWCVKKRYRCNDVITERYEVIGSQGIRRRAIAENDVLCGASGSFRIVHGNQGGNPAIIVQALVDWGFRKNIEGQDEVWIQWDYQEGTWYVEEMAEPLFARAQLNANTCPTDQFPAVSQFMYGDRKDYDCNFLPGNPDNAPGTVSNVPGLGGMAGDQILLRRDMTGKRDEETGWEIVQIGEHEESPYVDLSHQSCALMGTKQPMTVHKCKDIGQPAAVLQGTLQNVITAAGLDTSGGNCRIQMTQTQVCVLDVGSSAIIYPVTFNPTIVVEDVFDDTTALKQFKKNVYVPCVDPNTEHTIVDYFDCPPIQQVYQPQTA